MNLIVRNRVINAPIHKILTTLRSELSNGKLKDIHDEYQDNIAITCPKHKDGFERKASCQVYCRKDSDDVEYGKCHCFTCGYTASLPQLITYCFEEQEGFGEEWLVERFGVDYDENHLYLPEITLNRHVKKAAIPQSKIESMQYYHPYMWQRKLTPQVVNKFSIGYDAKSNMISFPVWDEQGKLVMITYRSVVDKRFYIDKDADKPVYLLNFIKNEKINKVYVCESQINALTLWSWGYPAVALFGTGSEYQYEILNRSPIREYVLCFDGDEAGDRGRARFMKNIRDDVFVSYIRLPRGKDVNDLEKSEFKALEVHF